MQNLPKHMCAFLTPAGVIDHEELLRRNTQHLMSAVSSLPELQVRTFGGLWEGGGNHVQLCVWWWGGG
jgi:hypothetical protein